MITKKELVEEVAATTNLPKNKTKTIMESVVSEIGASIKNDKPVQIERFGTFTKKDVKKRRKGNLNSTLSVTTFEGAPNIKNINFREVFGFQTIINR